MFQVEDGPSQIAGSYTRIIKIMKESGMGDQLIPASTVLAMLDAEGRSHDFAVERIHLDMVKTKLISLKDKLDLAKITSGGAEVLGVTERADEVDVTWRDCSAGGDGAERTRTFGGVVLATLAPQAAKIHTGLDPWRRELPATGVDHATIVQAHVGLDVAPVSKLSMVYSTEVSEKTKVLAVNLEHNKAPGRVPPGKAIATIFGADDWSKGVLDEEDGDLLIKELVEGGEALVPGVSDNVLLTHLTRWPWAWSKSQPGYWERMREFHRISDERDRLVRLAGDYFCVTSLNVAAASGERAARQIIGVRDAQS